MDQTPSLMPDLVQAVARHLITAIALVLVRQGFITDQQTTGFVGATMFFVGIGWSFYHKWDCRQKLQAAKASPASDVKNPTGG